MDDLGLHSNPRKKLKIEHSTTSSASVNAMDTTSGIPCHSREENEQTMREAACGITEFVSPDLLGFSGILKKRYTDFLVNEILPSGEVIHLDNLGPPMRIAKKEAQTDLNNNTQPSNAPIGSYHASATVKKATSAYVKKKASDAGGIGTMKFDQTPIPAQPEAGHAKQEDVKKKQNEDVEQSTMKGSFSLHVEKPAPHLRVPSTAPLTAPPTDEKKLDTSAEPKLEPVKRTRQKVHISYTSKGWVEFDEEDERKLKEGASAGDLVDGQKENSAPKEKIEQVGDDLEGQGVKTKNEADEQRKISYAPQPSTPASWQAYANAVEGPAAKVAESGEPSPPDMSTLLSYFTPEVVDAIGSLYNRVTSSTLRKAKDYGSVKSAPIDRVLRTKVHQDIRNIFKSRLDTMTDSKGAVIITAMSEQSAYNSRAPSNRNDRGNDQKDNRSNIQVPRGKSRWEELGGDYLHFSLYKENKDTMECISYLARQLNMFPKSFAFAGTKDRRGVTVQRVSVHRVFVNRLIDAARQIRSAYVGNYSYHPHKLQLGELKGNEFIITLRDCNFHYPDEVDDKTVVEGAKAIVGEAVQKLADRGFLNYYGLQRFGTFSTSTDAIGVAMLQGNFREAVAGILHYKPALLDAPDSKDKISMDDRDRAQAINSFQTSGSADAALDKLPRKFSAESSIIRHLSKRGQNNDYLGALNSISRNLRLMYVHAYQSLVWNMAASERWRKFGNSVIEGDLVLVDEHKPEDGSKIKAEGVDVDGEIVIHPSVGDQADNTEDPFVRARPLSKDEAEGGKFNIFDVVLPTPGYDILYPDNMVTFYQDLMASEMGGGLDPHDMRRKSKDMSLSGSYRKLLAKPGRELTFEVKTYVDEDEQFVETDMDRYFKLHPKKDRTYQGRGKFYKGEQNTAKAEEGVDIKQEMDGANESAPKSTGVPSSTDTDASGGVRLDWNGQPKEEKKIAVILKLQLGSGQYATMALRELMKLGGVRTFKADFSGGR